MKKNQTLNELTIKEAREKLKKREITSLELTEACLAQIKKINKKLNACLTICEKEALQAAKEADKKIKNGENGQLLGIPYLCKDNIMTRGTRTTAASKILENYTAPYDATIIKKLREAGAVLLGKTNMDEFGHGASTENSAFGLTRNPYDLERVSGGSSGGSAAGVAANMCIFALGTDTGGSIRQPASFCGAVGLKPTYGRASRFGLIAMTSSTDVPGVITKTVEDAAIVLSVIAGADKNDATTVDKILLTPFNKGGSLKGLTIGLPKEYFVEGVEKSVKEKINEAIEKLKEMGVKFREVSLPYTKYGIPVYYIITPSEISSNLARFDGIRYGYSEHKNGGNYSLYDIYAKSRGKGFGPEAKRRIMLGTYALSAGYYDAYYLKAQKVRTKIKDEMDKVLEKVDCLLTPTSPHPAFKTGENSSDPLKMYLEDIFVTGASLAGLPAISIPCGYAPTQSLPPRSSREGDIMLPVGMQLIGKRLDEEILFRIGEAYEKETNWRNFKKLAI